MPTLKKGEGVDVIVTVFKCAARTQHKVETRAGRQSYSIHLLDCSDGPVSYPVLLNHSKVETRAGRRILSISWTVVTLNHSKVETRAGRQLSLANWVERRGVQTEAGLWYNMCHPTYNHPTQLRDGLCAVASQHISQNDTVRRRDVGKGRGETLQAALWRMNRCVGGEGGITRGSVWGLAGRHSDVTALLTDPVTSVAVPANLYYSLHVVFALVFSLTTAKCAVPSALHTKYTTRWECVPPLPAHRYFTIHVNLKLVKTEIYQKYTRWECVPPLPALRYFTIHVNLKLVKTEIYQCVPPLPALRYFTIHVNLKQPKTDICKRCECVPPLPALRYLTIHGFPVETSQTMSSATHPPTVYTPHSTGSSNKLIITCPLSVHLFTDSRTFPHLEQTQIQQPPQIRAEREVNDTTISLK
ncbi:hypothetical protein J6590_005168 [Homalodisca vitripennis]|nr:hypothetical protein J6590_005168 [Homalodisca vitripennis]